MHSKLDPGNQFDMTDAQLRRVIYSNWDFQQALSALTFLMEECDFDAKYTNVQLRKFRCYETSVVIAFARPFEISRGRTSIGLKALGVRLDGDELVLKERMLNLRRQVVAHSDEDSMHFRGSLMQPFEDHEVTIPLFKFNETLHLNVSELRPLEALLGKLMHAVTHTLFKIAQVAPERLDVYKAPASG